MLLPYDSISNSNGWNETEKLVGSSSYSLQYSVAVAVVVVVAAAAGSW